MESVSNANILGTVLHPVSLLGGGGREGRGEWGRESTSKESCQDHNGECV